LQRVKRASVTVDAVVTGRIEAGLLILAAFRSGDSAVDLQWMAKKLVELRIFADDEGKMNRSLLDIEGSILLVSQFTLYGDVRKGRRPSFIDSAPPDEALRLYHDFEAILEETGVPIACGIFGADMQVELLNDGPVTLSIDRPEVD
jgi:D-tyrosyl-tRNA(Tyr) deacylase